MLDGKSERKIVGTDHFLPSSRTSTLNRSLFAVKAIQFCPLLPLALSGVLMLFVFGKRGCLMTHGFSFLFCPARPLLSRLSLNYRA